MTPQDERVFKARRASRNNAIGIVLALLVVLFFAITVVRMKP